MTRSSIAHVDRRMCFIAALTLTVFHPGYCFPQMQTYKRNPTNGDVALSKLQADTPPAETA